MLRSHSCERSVLSRSTTGTPQARTPVQPSRGSIPANRGPSARTIPVAKRARQSNLRDHHLSQERGTKANVVEVAVHEDKRLAQELDVNVGRSHH